MRPILLLLLLFAAPALGQDFPLDGNVVNPGPSAGLAVDTNNNLAFDPTQNVLNAIQEQADRSLERARWAEALTVERVRRVDQMIEMQAKLANSERMSIEKRTDDLRDAAILQRNEALSSAEKLSSSRFAAIEKQAELERQSSALLRDTETKRVNDVLAVTAKALETATTAQTETAKTLAAQVQSLATGLASQVDTAATATATNLQRVEERIAVGQSGLGDRLTLLEQFQNQGAGRQSVADPQIASQLTAQAAILDKLVTAQATGSGRQAITDPQIAALITTVDELIKSQANSTGKEQGQTTTVLAIAGVITIFFTILGGIGVVVTIATRKRDTAQPHIVYVPGMPPVVPAQPT
jgi:hypothetical protein